MGKKKAAGEPPFLLFLGVIGFARGANEMLWFNPKNIVFMNRRPTELTDAECFFP
jgi:hypothetical protein